MSNEKKYLKETKFHQRLKNLETKFASKKILIYGAGLLFEEAYKNYNFSALNIIGISDMKFTETGEFMGLQAVCPSDIKTINPDIILVSIKEYKSIVNRFINQFPGIDILPLVEKPILPPFQKRNLNHNHWIAAHGLHGKKPTKISYLKHFQMNFNYFIGKIDIPQVEFNLTTRCTLRCKHCSNFIPQLKSDEHCLINIDDFKKQINNLLKPVNQIQNLLLIGGEPLLVQNLEEYLEFAASKKKIKRVWIVTNGTLLMSEKLINIAKKYRNKVTIWISNYSKNEELKQKLKHNELLNQIKTNNLDYDYVQDLNWGYTSPLNSDKKRNESQEYFAQCHNNCVSVFGGKMFVCPRAGVFVLKKIYEPQNNDFINLNQKVSRRSLKEFYSKDYFTACNYCTVLEDQQHNPILPAIQL